MAALLQLATDAWIAQRQNTMEKVCELMDETPLSEDVYQDYDKSKERIQEANYQTDLALRRLQAQEA